MFPSEHLCKSSRYIHPALLLLISILWLSGCGGGGTTTVPPPQSPALNPAPAVASLSQSSVTASSAGLNLTIAGSGFVEGSIVQWNQTNRVTTFVSSTQLQVALTAADLDVGGTAQIVVVNPGPGGGASTPITFTVNNPAPQVSGVSPSSVTTVDGGRLITVTGNGFVSDSSVTWNGASRSTSYVSATQLQFNLSPTDVAAAGAAQVSVVNPAPGGGVAPPSQIAIIYPVPAISSLAPAAVAAGGQSFVLTVNGFGFSPASIVLYNSAARATTYVNSSALTIVVSATDIATPTTSQIAVVTSAPGGGTSAP